MRLRSLIGLFAAMTVAGCGDGGTGDSAGANDGSSTNPTGGAGGTSAGSSAQASGGNGSPGQSASPYVPSGPPGSLDTSFAGTGFAVQRGPAALAPFRPGAFGSAIALDRDHRLVVVGGTDDSGYERHLAAWRFEESGALDATFAQGGKWFSSPYGTGLDVCIDAQGRMLLTGANVKTTKTPDPYDGMGLFRLTSAGQLDPEFGTAGAVMTVATVNGNDAGNSVACGSSGAVVTGTGGQIFDIKMLTWRFDDSGAPLASFGGSGHVLVTGRPTGNAQSPIEARGDRVLIDAQGRVLVVGVQANELQPYGACTIWRFNGDGTPDLSFNGTGLVTQAPDVGTFEPQCNAAAFDAEGRIVLLGHTTDLAYVARLTTDGTFDPTFGPDGIVRLPQPELSYSGARNVVIDSKGRIVVAGSESDGGLGVAKNARAAVWRLTSAGAIDTSFGAQGVAYLTSSGELKSDAASSLVVDRFDRPVVVGATSIKDGDQIESALAVWRLNP